MRFPVLRHSRMNVVPGIMSPMLMDRASPLGSMLSSSRRILKPLSMSRMEREDESRERVDLDSPTPSPSPEHLTAPDYVADPWHLAIRASARAHAVKRPARELYARCVCALRTLPLGRSGLPDASCSDFSPRIRYAEDHLLSPCALN